MAEIKIKNVGPVREANLTLNKVNVFMGPQSSGKSTIAKIISYCTWIEKYVATSQLLDEYNNNEKHFKERLEKYHKMNGYFQSDSYISYKSNVVEMEYKAKKFSIKWKDRYAYKRSKISYIPSERNIITLPEVKKVEFGDTNIRSFLFEWYDARRSHTKSKKLSLLNLGVNYYYNEKADEDYIIHQNGKSYDILLSDASSGLQSITPLLAMIDYMILGVYNQEETISFDLKDRRQRSSGILLEELLYKKYFGDNYNRSKEQLYEIREKIQKGDGQIDVLVEGIMNVQKMLFTTHSSQLIIEEPEQNLFPETQRDLIYYLLEKCLDKKREHRLTITTHSPYILYALNNCMMGAVISDKLSKNEKKGFLSKNSWISPNEVNIFQIKDGTLLSIKNKKTGTVDKHYFNGIMKEIMDEYLKMLSFYAGEENNEK